MNPLEQRGEGLVVDGHSISDHSLPKREQVGTGVHTHLQAAKLERLAKFEADAALPIGTCNMYESRVTLGIAKVLRYTNRYFESLHKGLS